MANWQINCAVANNCARQSIDSLSNLNLVRSVEGLRKAKRKFYKDRPAIAQFLFKVFKFQIFAKRRSTKHFRWSWHWWLEKTLFWVASSKEQFMTWPAVFFLYSYAGPSSAGPISSSASTPPLRERRNNVSEE